MKKSPLPPRQSPMARSRSLSRAAFRSRRKARTPEEVAGRKATAGRSGGWCEIDPADPAHDIHHRKNQSQGGDWQVPNLAHVCRRHHGLITTNPEWARSLGLSVRRADDPAAIPVQLAVGLVLLLPDGTYQPVREDAA